MKKTIWRRFALALLLSPIIWSLCGAPQARAAQTEGAAEKEDKISADGAEEEEIIDSRIFDAAYYAKNNPDVVKAVRKFKDSDRSEEELLYTHYLKYGIKEGRKGCEEDIDFDFFTLNVISYDEQEGQILGMMEHGVYTGDVIVHVPSYLRGLTIKKGESCTITALPVMTMSLPPQMSALWLEHEE